MLKCLAVCLLWCLIPPVRHTIGGALIFFGTRRNYLFINFHVNAEKAPKDIPCETIIEWMNEWRGGKGNDASSVPKFVESRDVNHSHIRVLFDGMYV